MQHQVIIKKISSMLHAWDPIGITPDDEYNDLSFKLFKRIVAGESQEQLVDFTDDYLKHFVGLSDVNKADIAANVSLILHEYNKAVG